MKIRNFILGLVFLLGTVAWAQPGSQYQQNPTAPDCQIPFTFTATGANDTTVTPGLCSTGDNRQTGVMTWTLTYASTGFSAVTITLQSAPGAGYPSGGAFVTFAGSVVTGSNPMTSTAGGAATLKNGTVAIPWVRVDATTTGSGTIVGVLQGWQSRTGGGSAVCALTGTQTTGYVLTALDNGTACDWETVGGGPSGLSTNAVTCAATATSLKDCTSAATIPVISVANSASATNTGYRAYQMDGTTLTTLLSINGANNVSIDPHGDAGYVSYGAGLAHGGTRFLMRNQAGIFAESFDGSQDLKSLETDASNNLHLGNATLAGSSQMNDLYLDVQTGKSIHLAINGTNIVDISSAGIIPTSTNALTLGSTTKYWSSIYGTMIDGSNDKWSWATAGGGTLAGNVGIVWSSDSHYYGSSDTSVGRGGIGLVDIGSATNPPSCATAANCRDLRRRFDIYIVGANIASATTIAPVAPVTHITGTAAIDTITAPTNMAVSGNGGCLRLIPDGVFTTTTGGNIALASTAVVGKSITMCYDNGTSKWYPSY